MKRGAILVNVARGDVVDTETLIAALRTGQISAAALDVCDPEPPPPDSPLVAMDNVIVTAHVASASEKAVRTLRESVAHIVACAIKGEPLQNVVNGVTPELARGRAR